MIGHIQFWCKVREQFETLDLAEFIRKDKDSLFKRWVAVIRAVDDRDHDLISLTYWTDDLNEVNKVCKRGFVKAEGILHMDPVLEGPKSVSILGWRPISRAAYERAKGRLVVKANKHACRHLEKAEATV